MTLEQCIETYGEDLQFTDIRHLLKPVDEMPFGHKEIFLAQFPTHISRHSSIPHAIGSTQIVNRILFYLEVIAKRDEKGNLNRYWQLTKRIVEYY